MTSQIRVDEITNRSGLGTVTIYDNGFEFTGVTTFTEDVDITGGLTIGGVLTYEDVTNIDSVGVVTARGGIRVTGDSIHVESSEDRLLYLKSTDANAYLTFEDTDSSSAFANRVGTVSDGLYFSTGGGGERVRIDASGRVLIGRTTQLASSAERLTIDSGMAMFRRSSNNAAAVYIRNEDSTADTRHPYLIFTDGSGNRGGFGIQNDEASLWISGQQGIAFRTSGSAPSQEERLRITTAGLVGIGTDNPATNLDVNGSLQLRASGNYTNYATRIYSRLDSTHCTVIESYLNNSTAFEMMGSYADGGGANPRIVLGAGGQKVGINETAPDRQLHVKSGANSDDGVIRIESANDNIMDAGTDGTGHFLNCVNTDPFRIKFAGTEKLRINSDGNIGMGGITSPSFTTGGGIHLKRNYGIGFGDGSNGRPDFQLVTTGGSTLDFRCGFGADTADIQMTTGGNLVFASGGGIDFSATGDGSGTVVSELFDDYEEGSFTPTIEWGGTSATLTGGTYGRYTKIGNTVIINFRIIQSSRNATSGSIRMYGLPYNEGSSAAYNHGMVQMDSGGNMPSGAGSIMMYFSNNNVRFLYQTNTAHSDLDASHCVDGTAWYGFATYFTS